MQYKYQLLNILAEISQRLGKLFSSNLIETLKGDYSFVLINGMFFKLPDIFFCLSRYRSINIEYDKII